MYPMLMLTGFLGLCLPEDVVDQMVCKRVVVVERQVRLEARVCTGDPLGSQDDKTMRVISQPTLSIRHKQTAYFQVTGSEQHGVTFRATPRLRLDGKIGLECETTLSAVNSGRGIQTVGGFTPGVDSKTVKTSAVLTPGKTLKVRLSANSLTEQTWIELRADVTEPSVSHLPTAEPARMAWTTTYHPPIVAVGDKVIALPPASPPPVAAPALPPAK